MIFDIPIKSHYYCIVNYILYVIDCSTNLLIS